MSQAGNPHLRCSRSAAIAFAVSFCSAGIAARGAELQPASTAHSATTPGLSVEELAKLPHVIFAQDLKDVPGSNLVVVALDFPPVAANATGATPPCSAHRHPGSTYVYVTKGAVRLGIGGQPVQTLHAGQSFYEPAGALHTVAENASATEPAAAIAVLILPHGAPILTPEKCGQP